MSNKNDKKKTKAKRLGIKSILIHGDNRLAITTFGKGNDAEIALTTDTKGNEVKDKLPTKVGGGQVHKIAPDIDIKGKDYQNNKLDVLLNNPAEHAGEDYLKLKSQLEKEFFGKEFPNDNIRIQIIHNILDIQKILGIYITDIIYCVNNLQDTPEDIVGLAMKDETVKINLGKMLPYLGFFGEVFQVPPKIATNLRENVGKLKGLEIQLNSPSTPRFKQANLRLDIDNLKKEKNISRNDIKKYEEYCQNTEIVDKHNKSVLRLLGACRQCTAHFKGKDSIFFLESQKLKETLKNTYSKADWDIIEQSYTKRTESINKTFLDHSKVNLRILFDIFDDVEEDEIIEEYFRFAILKDGKNLGLNMTQLRETMLITDDYLKLIKEDQKYDSCRSKIYCIIDYILYRQLHDTDELNNMVAQLRVTQDTDEKKILYKSFAKTAWEQTQQYILPFCERFSGNSYPVFDSTPLNTQLDKRLQKITVSDIPFVQILAFLCNFLDGKEINELLSAYIHKFENVQSFIDTLQELGETVNFMPSYELFNGNGVAGKIAQQLRFIVSIGKMKGDLSDAKRPLFKAAIRMLGIEKLEIEQDEEKFNKWLEENVLTGDPSKKKDCNPFRNFIAKQVIESRRFIYLVRYTKPQTVRTLMQNRHIVRYVLTRLPETQIDKYYERIDNGNEKELSKKIDVLTNKLSVLSFQSLVNNRGKIKDASSRPGKQNVEIERLKGLVRLYLTVAFVAIKNLVKTNARYYIAFAVFDRDFHLFTEKLKNDPDFKQKIGKYDNRFAITEYFLDNDDKKKYIPDPNLSDAENKKALFEFLDLRENKQHFTKKWNKILRDNISEAKKIQETGGLLVEVRNHAEHLNVLMNLEKYVGDFRKNNNKPMQSYFELYHYVLQRMMSKPEYLKEWNIKEFADDVEKYNTPSHNWIKYAYVSLGYNLPRYKNLTIEALFDEDSEPGKVLTDKWKQMEDEKKRNN
ncbi:MAG: type VI-D CRISPR-associated RNA-guided ribonuclease Cas13d [Planctomycetaceae bacterium]|nr:type VI-D CRISPR-associated RNA-guided ribonuclease Cas13d [Planctomycetaceae bacterium]